LPKYPTGAVLSACPRYVSSIYANCYFILGILTAPSPASFIHKKAKEKNMEIIIRPKIRSSQLENIGVRLDWRGVWWYALDKSQ
jgi:hypothetical protein